jgi:hypothetical protein
MHTALQRRMNWIHVAQVRDQWRAAGNTGTNIWVSYKSGEFLYQATVNFSRRTCLIELVIKTPKLLRAGSQCI